MQNEIDCLHVRIQELHNIVHYLVKTMKRNDALSNNMSNTSTSLPPISRDSTFPFDLNYYSSVKNCNCLQNMLDMNSSPYNFNAIQTSSSFVQSDDCDSYITTSSKMNPDRRNNNNGIQDISDMMKALPIECQTRFVDQLVDTIVKNIRNTYSTSDVPNNNSSSGLYDSIIPESPREDTIMKSSTVISTSLPENSESCSLTLTNTSEKKPQQLSVRKSSTEDDNTINKLPRHPSHSDNTNVVSSIEAPLRQQIVCNGVSVSHLTSSLSPQQQHDKTAMRGNSHSASTSARASVASVTRSLTQTVSCLSNRIVRVCSSINNAEKKCHHATNNDI